MSAAFGLHFGSTSACLAVYKDGKTDVVANDAGDRTTPAVVAYTDHDQTVGLAAKQGIVRNATNTICHVKQVIGKSYKQHEKENSTSGSYAKVINKEDKILYEVDYKEKTLHVSPEEVATKIYKKMMETATSHGDGDIHDCVLTAPRDFSSQQRQILSDCATKAGFNILRVINEPTAALLAYDIGQLDIEEYCNTVVYRLGGVSLDVTVVTCCNGMFRLLSTVTHADIGGDSFNDAIIEYFCGEFKRQWKEDIRGSKRSISKLKVAAERCKHTLSTLPESQCHVDSLYDGIDFNGKISRARFEGLCSGLVQRCLNPLETALKEAGLQKNEINKVILTGGAAKTPVLQSQLQNYFPGAELLNSTPPDEVIAVGAAKQAAILTGNENHESKQNEQETEVECIVSPIQIKLMTDDTATYSTIFPAMMPVPGRRQRKIQLGPQQTSCVLEVFEQRDEENRILIGKVVLRDLPVQSEVLAVFHARREGSIHITCTEKTSGKHADILIEVE
ncbi:unnamed protein product [Owenia fusiformis]|uniref:Uncharacterized protein n=1 Tax=Owenia fusiformis TaxID=6347 RepID=A0A8J1XGF5_OWEFU|nr:unnamed protein product [Owenia fusiformis]